MNTLNKIKYFGLYVYYTSNLKLKTVSILKNNIFVKSFFSEPLPINKYIILTFLTNQYDS
jgi:hypothetical protein